jgi:PiT family inorganic phosphate transporter
VYWDGLIKVAVCWIATPIGALILSVVLYYVFRFFFLHMPMSLLTRDKIIWSGLVLVGAYGSYALGANNVANATGIFSGLVPGLDDRALCLAGGIAIALGVMTWSRRVMTTVGQKVMILDGFTALVAVSSMSLTVHMFAIIGVPVSTSQAIVGAIIGIGLVRGVHTIHLNEVHNIVFGWIMTPAIALILSAAGHAVLLRH